MVLSVTNGPAPMSVCVSSSAFGCCADLLVHLPTATTNTSPSTPEQSSPTANNYACPAATRQPPSARHASITAPSPASAPTTPRAGLRQCHWGKAYRPNAHYPATSGLKLFPPICLAGLSCVLAACHSPSFCPRVHFQNLPELLPQLAAVNLPQSAPVCDNLQLFPPRLPCC